MGGGWLGAYIYAVQHISMIFVKSFALTETTWCPNSHGDVCHPCAPHASLQMLQRLRVPTHQMALSSPADVTRPASVIERDANPAPLQSLVVGGVGPRAILRETPDTRKLEKGNKGQTQH